LNLLGRKPSGNPGRVEEMPSEYRWNLCAVHLVFEGGFLSGIFFFFFLLLLPLLFSGPSIYLPKMCYY
jgi:hypothetical protein